MSFILGLFSLLVTYLGFKALLSGNIFLFLGVLLTVIFLLEVSQKAIEGSAKRAEQEKRQKMDALNERLKARDQITSKIRKRMKIAEVDYKYGRIPESIYQTVKLLKGYYSLEEWADNDPETYNALTEDQINSYRETLYKIANEN